MSARARQSTTAGPSAGGFVTIPLPPYQPPENPINPQGQRFLHGILAKHGHSKLEQHLRQAAEALGDNAGRINERLSERKHQHKSREEKHANNLSELNEQRARHLEDLEARTAAMTRRLEEATRKTIDGQEFAGYMQDELKNIERQAIDNASASQRLTQTLRREDDDDGGDDMTEYDPTLPGETQQNHQRVQVIVPKDIFQQRIEAQRRSYQELALATRYAEHPDYVRFKRSVHDGLHPEGGPSLPHASTWFTRDGPAPGVTHSAGDDSDDDIVVASERISTKCPLTLQELKDPVTSAKCPHTFERAAISELFRRSNAFTGGSNARGARSGQRTVQCPVGGCDKMLTQQDLRQDESLIRKIRRIQKRREEMEDGSDDEHMEDSRAQVINSDDADGFEDLDQPASQRIVPKMERSSGFTRSAGVGSSRNGGVGYDETMEGTIVDLGSESEDE
ncbi:Zinc finger MIZ-type protein [Macrophomina phaseolina MS6]|uniref:Zinc finger MIZ-type protein n=1 Tax=Macrophomina phaseolina (strain MS6) TaxID=1126212 RepID=K2S452_MACPH|nr:Zinc finger MIZ-type protein [Macrophomina phaseolina MS6]